ncbi:MAG TPA: DUF4382 domain-containing protein, partial [Chitinophagaceae bacterium]|nr:DUF4382 domain-containing protein [Chitinophagaceae bacterium]
MKGSTIRNSFFVTALVSISLFTACSKNSKNSDQAQIQVSLVDNPAPGVKEVWVDIRQVEVIVNDSSHPVVLNAIHPGIYNLLELTNGKDTLLADASIPAGTISQVRLILGDNNYIVTSTGAKLSLKTPSGQQSGLKVQIHQQVSGGVLYRLTLDFDVARSIVFAGNSDNIILKPVLRILSFAPSGGNLRGVVVPGTSPTAVIAIKGTDTIATTFTVVPGGNYFIKDVPAGNYSLSFIPSD